MNQYFEDIKSKNFKVNVYKSPVAAAIWSACLPGFGQFYVRDYIIGIILVIWEIAVNVLAKINWSIYFSFTGELQKSLDVVDWGWGLFYPSVYVFNIWHAYDRARVINSELQERGVPTPKQYSHLLGFFIGLFLGMFFGLHWTFLVSPVLSGCVLGLVFGVIGHLIEKILVKRFDGG
ncbi:hypothetical protein [Bacillus sp. AK031]